MRRWILRCPGLTVALGAELAAVGLLSGVDTEVRLEVAGAAEALPALTAGVGFLAGVPSAVAA